jgi:hypothetical protein
MFSKEELDRARRRAYVEWYRCEESGRKLGLFIVVRPLYLAVLAHRPTPTHREWVGLAIGWRGKEVLNTFERAPKKGQ